MCIYMYMYSYVFIYIYMCVCIPLYRNYYTRVSQFACLTSQPPPYFVHLVQRPTIGVEDRGRRDLQCMMRAYRLQGSARCPGNRDTQLPGLPVELV